ncbi:hypothetical protein HD554DRAFT_1606344 [Boletus coccyginus]|nr:hypothetical protein HD554DRAFT_1606344 [Boletus coccyginus]
MRIQNTKASTSSGGHGPLCTLRCRATPFTCVDSELKGLSSEFRCRLLCGRNDVCCVCSGKTWDEKDELSIERCLRRVEAPKPQDANLVTIGDKPCACMEWNLFMKLNSNSLPGTTQPEHEFETYEPAPLRRMSSTKTDEAVVIETGGFRAIYSVTFRPNGAHLFLYALSLLPEHLVQGTLSTHLIHPKAFRGSKGGFRRDSKRLAGIGIRHHPINPPQGLVGPSLSFLIMVEGEYPPKGTPEDGCRTTRASECSFHRRQTVVGYLTNYLSERSGNGSIGKYQDHRSKPSEQGRSQ